MAKTKTTIRKQNSTGGNRKVKNVSTKVGPKRPQQAETTTPEVTKRTEKGSDSYSMADMKTWKPIDNKLRELVEQVIDSNVNRSRFASDETVSDAVKDTSRVLKAKLRNLKVPKSSLAKNLKLKEALNNLNDQLESQTQQKRELWKAIKAEKRQMDLLKNMEDSSEKVHLAVKVPKDQLDLPDIF